MLLALFVLGAASCGSNDDSTAADGSSASDSASSEADSAAEQIKAVQADFVQSIRQGDYQQACDLLTQPMRKQAATNGPDCVSSFDAIFSASPLDEELKLTRVKVDGNNATASANSPDGFLKSTIEFTNQNGTWLISGPLAKQER